MKILLDQNLSYRLVYALQSTIPELTHVKFEGLQDADDYEIWQFARRHNYTIITFDIDFYELQIVKGFPPRIIWLRSDNMTKKESIVFFQQNIGKIRDFLTNREFKDIGCLEFR